MPPTTAFSLIQELVHRDGLRIALAGRDDVLLEPILRLLVKYVTDPRFGDLAMSVSTIVIGKSSPQSSFRFIADIRTLYRHVYSCAWPVTIDRRSVRSVTQKSRRGTSVPKGAHKSKGSPRHDLRILRISCLTYSRLYLSSDPLYLSQFEYTVFSLFYNTQILN